VSFSLPVLAATFEAARAFLFGLPDAACDESCSASARRRLVDAQLRSGERAIIMLTGGGTYVAGAIFSAVG
jgi:hypothetical protein